MSKISFDTEYDGYVFVGAAEGKFETENKEMRPYCNIFVVSPVSSWSSDNYQAFGFKAEKLSCVSPDVYSGVELGSRVKLFFDAKRKVNMMAIDG